MCKRTRVLRVNNLQKSIVRRNRIGQLLSRAFVMYYSFSNTLGRLFFSFLFFVFLLIVNRLQKLQVLTWLRRVDASRRPIDRLIVVTHPKSAASIDTSSLPFLLSTSETVWCFVIDFVRTNLNRTVLGRKTGQDHGTLSIDLNSSF